MTVSTRALQRHVHATDDSHRVTSLELFFDLVFVYGLTQVTALPDGCRHRLPGVRHEEGRQYVADTGDHDVGDALATVPLVALYGGVVLYLLAHICFRLRNVRSVNRQRLGLAGCW